MNASEVGYPGPPAPAPPTDYSDASLTSDGPCTGNAAPRRPPPGSEQHKQSYSLGFFLHEHNGDPFTFLEFSAM